jgi:hypothetical protein
MAFLDNSGDIILDAVLTDTGRLRMAQGDGSFKITKFALGDDEINYGLYNKNHTSGSAYYDLEVLQTPVLEAFTNNTSNLKSKLVTMSRTNVLYMPILKLNAHNVNSAIGAGNGFVQPKSSAYFRRPTNESHSTASKKEGTNAADKLNIDKFYVAVDNDTYKGLARYRSPGATDPAAHIVPGDSGGQLITGVLEGFMGPNIGGMIRVDQGLDTEEISIAQGLDSDLREGAYIVELDYRLGRLKSPSTNTVKAVNFIDDDNIASYFVSETPYFSTVAEETNSISDTNILNDLPSTNPQVFGNGKGTGPRGTSIHFRIEASAELRQSTYLFKQVGQTQDLTTTFGEAGIAGLPGAIDSALTGDKFLHNLTEKKLYYIDSTVRVIGANTGYRLDIPIRYVKLA